MKEKIDALKGRRVVVYLRVSTEEQAGTLSAQKAAVTKGLRDLGYKGKITFFEEQASGTKLEREQLRLAIAEAMK